MEVYKEFGRINNGNQIGSPLDKAINHTRAIVYGVTIDTEGTKVFDDGFDVVLKENGGFKTLVSIPDTFELIEKGSIDDLRIIENGLNGGVDKRMIPNNLIHELSLGSTNGQSTTFEVDYDSNMSIKNIKVFPSYFQSKGNFSFQSFSKELQKEHPKEDFRNIFEFGKKLKLKRKSNSKAKAEPVKTFIEEVSGVVKEIMIHTNEIATWVLYQYTQKQGIYCHSHAIGELDRYWLPKNFVEGKYYSPKPLGSLFTKVTNPLRVFPDYLVQRILSSFLMTGKNLYNKKELYELLYMINYSKNSILLQSIGSKG